MKGKSFVFRGLLSIVISFALLGGLIPADAFAPLNVKAEGEQYSVTVNVNDEAGGKIQIGTKAAQTSDTEYFEEGTEVTIRAIPNEGYRLAYWNTRKPLGEVGSCEFTATVNDNIVYTAYFISEATLVSASMENIEIEKQNVGYTLTGPYLLSGMLAGTNHYVYKAISVLNTGNCDLGIQSFRFSGEDADKFRVFRGITNLYNKALIVESDCSEAFVLDQGATLTKWYVEPIEDLAVGTYEATLTLVEQCQGGLTTPVSATVKFTVTDDVIITTEESDNGTITGAGSYEKGTNVTLTATPAEHYEFDSWRCNGEEISTDNPYVFTATESATYEASFTQVEFKAAVTATEGGKVQMGDRAATDSTDSAYLSKDTEVNIKAIPNEGYRLAYWSRRDLSGESCKPMAQPSVLEINAVIDQDVEYTAHFIPTSSLTAAAMDNIEIEKQSVGYTVTEPYMISGIPAGTSHLIYKAISMKNTGSCDLAVQSFKLGGKNADSFRVFRGFVNLFNNKSIVESDSSDGYLLVPDDTLRYWYVEPIEDLAAGTYEATLTLVEQCQGGINEAVTANVSFSVTDNYLIGTDVYPAECGTVTGAGEYEWGKLVKLTATPADTYEFDHWEVSGTSVSTDNPYSFTAQETKNVTAVFTKNTYKVSISADPKEGGDVSTTVFEGTSGNLPKGKDVTVTATPKAGYRFVCWKDNGAKIGTEKTVTVKATTDHNLVACFDKLIEAQLPENRSIVYNGNEQTIFADMDAYTVSDASAKNVGKYTATFTLTENAIWKDGTTGPKTAEWEITPAEITVTAIAEERNYTEGNKSVTIHPVINGVCGEDKVELDLTEMKAQMEDDTVGDNKAVTVSGIRLKGDDVDNYVLKGQPEGVTVNILREGIRPKATIIAAPTANELVYNGKPQNLVSAGQVSGGTVLYALGNNKEAAPEDNAFTEAIPTAQNAGSYTVWYKVAGDDTHESIDPVSVTGIEISKAENVPAVPRARMTVSYDYSKVSDIDLILEGWVWSSEDADKELPVNSGVLVTAIYNGADKDNYNSITAEITVIREECKHTNEETRNITDPTCTTQGYTGDLYCTDCEEIKERGRTIRALGHDYAAPVYTWSADGKTCSATAVCKREGCLESSQGHTVSETVNTISSVKVDSTTETPGITTYTAKFSNALFADQIKDIEDIPLKKKEAVAEGTPLKAEDVKAEIVVISKEGQSPAVIYKASTDKEAKNAVIPSSVTIDGIEYKVTAVDENAFKGNTKIEKVEIPDTVTEIGKNAFSGCTKLKTVIVGENVTQIGDGAFSNCKALTKITIPAKTVKLGNNVFKGCRKLKIIIIRTTNLTTGNIGKKAFKNVGNNVIIKVPKEKKKFYTKLFRKKGLSKKVAVKSI